MFWCNCCPWEVNNWDQLCKLFKKKGIGRTLGMRQPINQPIGCRGFSRWFFRVKIMKFVGPFGIPICGTWPPFIQVLIIHCPRFHCRYHQSRVRDSGLNLVVLLKKKCTISCSSFVVFFFNKFLLPILASGCWEALLQALPRFDPVIHCAPGAKNPGFVGFIQESVRELGIYHQNLWLFWPGKACFYGGEKALSMINHRILGHPFFRPKFVDVGDGQQDLWLLMLQEMVKFPWMLTDGRAVSNFSTVVPAEIALKSMISFSETPETDVQKWWIF